jgi:AcrR family transcriptional regulator
MSRDDRPKQVRGTAVREKILSVADELFYREGIRAVGVDTIVEKSDVAKTSLYRWFPGKDDLIAAFLERRDEHFWQQWDKTSRQYREDPRGEVEAQLHWISRYVLSGQFRGCPFINTATEFPDPSHPGRAVCMTNKEKLRRRLLGLAEALEVTEPNLLADQLVLLIDGAFANAQILRRASAARSLVSAGLALIAAASGHDDQGSRQKTVRPRSSK